MASLLDALERERLLKDSAAASEALPKGEPSHVSLLRLCEAGLLVGGLTVAYGVRPDELVGSLTAAMGGAAKRLKVVELHVAAGDVTERWEVEDVAALVHNLNDLYRDASDVRAVAVLGEWEDSLQLWCVERRALGRLLRQSFFAPVNARALADLVPSR
jgi:hypothetical protein